MQPATRESKRDFRVSESPTRHHTQEHTQTHMKIGRLSGVTNEQLDGACPGIQEIVS
jgi:hypothetical protein